MRAQPFLNWLYTNYQPGTAMQVASNPQFRGGWEGWLQVEIARTFIQNQTQLCAREVCYPDGNGQFISYDAEEDEAHGGVANRRAAARADFFMRRNEGIADDTYIELKTSSFAAGNPMRDAWWRFYEDTLKIAAIQEVNPAVNCFSMLAYWGTLETTPWGFGNGNVAWFWQGGRTAYVWDTVPIVNPLNPIPAVPTLEAAFEAAEGYGPQQPRLIFVTCGLG
jgi:hypothetical protein